MLQWTYRLAQEWPHASNGVVQPVLMVQLARLESPGCYHNSRLGACCAQRLVTEEMLQALLHAEHRRVLPERPAQPEQASRNGRQRAPAQLPLVLTDGADVQPGSDAPGLQQHPQQARSWCSDGRTPGLHASDVGSSSGGSAPRGPARGAALSQLAQPKMRDALPLLVGSRTPGCQNEDWGVERQGGYPRLNPVVHRMHP